MTFFNILELFFILYQAMRKTLSLNFTKTLQAYKLGPVMLFETTHLTKELQLMQK